MRNPWLSRLTQVGWSEASEETKEPISRHDGADQRPEEERKQEGWQETYTVGRSRGAQQCSEETEDRLSYRQWLDRVGWDYARTIQCNTG